MLTSGQVDQPLADERELERVQQQPRHEHLSDAVVARALLHHAAAQVQYGAAPGLKRVPARQWLLR